MLLKKITDKTSVLITPFANVGLYYLTTDTVVLIDTGHIHASKDLLHFIKNQNIMVHTIINTHGHIDHLGGNFILQETYGCKIAMPYLDHIFCEDISRYYLSFSTSVVEGLDVYGEGTFDVAHLFKEDTEYVVEGNTFGIIELKGHTYNHKGVVTPEGVCFLGDSIMAEKTLESAKFAVVSNLNWHHESLDKIKTLNYPYYVLGHGDLVYTDNMTLHALCDENHKYFDMKCASLLETFDKLTTFDNLMANLNKQYGLRRNIFKYFVAERSIKAMLSYLESKGIIEIRILEGMLSYCKV